jgi:hypothetical protein
MKELKIKNRWLTISMITMFILSLLFAFGWFNSEVSYKYEVQDTIYSGKPLDEHQKEILYYITTSKVGLICTGVLLIIIMYISAFRPTFKGRISYPHNRNNNDVNLVN